jgi:hypothetical protein
MAKARRLTQRLSNFWQTSGVMDCGVKRSATPLFWNHEIHQTHERIGGGIFPGARHSCRFIVTV